MSYEDTIELSKQLFADMKKRETLQVDRAENLILREIADEDVAKKVRLAFIHLVNSETHGGVGDVFESAEKEIVDALS